MTRLCYVTWILAALLNAVLGVLVYIVLTDVWPYGYTFSMLFSLSEDSVSSWWFAHSIIYRIASKVPNLIILFILCLIEAFRNIVLNRRYAVLLEALLICIMSLDLIVTLIYMLISVLALFIMLKLMGLLGLDIKIHGMEVQPKYCVRVSIANVIKREKILELLACYTCTTYVISLLWLYMLVYALWLPIPHPILSAGLVSVICMLLILRNLFRGCIVKPMLLIITGLVPSGPTLVV